MGRYCLLAVVIAILSCTRAFSQATTRPAAGEEPRFYSHVPWGVEFWMEGTVKNVASVDGGIRFDVAGRFWMWQYPPNAKEKVAVEVHPEGTFPAVVSQGVPFFAMTADWRGGAIREGGELLRILRAAERSGSVVKFEVSEPEMAFGPGGSFSLKRGVVGRATDVELR